MTVIINPEPYTPPLGDAIDFTMVTASLGRKMYVQKDGATIAGLRVTTPTTAAESVDVTDVNSQGYRELMSDFGQWSLDIGVDGITKDSTLRDAVQNSSDISFTDCTLVYSDGVVISGDYKLIDLTETAEYRSAISFTATLQLSGIPQIG